MFLKSKKREIIFALALFLSFFSDHSKMWEVYPGIRVESLLLTCEWGEFCAKPDAYCLHGARCRNNLSPEFPHFEVGSNIP